jgi:hypothetical protein
MLEIYVKVGAWQFPTDFIPACGCRKDVFISNFNFIAIFFIQDLGQIWRRKIEKK